MFNSSRKTWPAYQTLFLKSLAACPCLVLSSHSAWVNVEAVLSQFLLVLFLNLLFSHLNTCPLNVIYLHVQRIFFIPHKEYKGKKGFLFLQPSFLLFVTRGSCSLMPPLRRSVSDTWPDTHNTGSALILNRKNILGLISHWHVCIQFKFLKSLIPTSIHPHNHYHFNSK